MHLKYRATGGRIVCSKTDVGIRNGYDYKAYRRKVHGLSIGPSHLDNKIRYRSGYMSRGAGALGFGFWACRLGHTPMA